MKRFIQIINRNSQNFQDRFLKVSKVFLMLVGFSGLYLLKAQSCSTSPSCTSTISVSSGTALTVNSGEVICITNGYTGAITVNSGGTLLVTGASAFSSNVTTNSGGIFDIGASANPSGTLTLSGGTLNVLSGGTLSRNCSPGTASIINNCGTISGTRTFNSNVTLNNYSSTTLNLSWGGNTLNNFANNVTINAQDINTTCQLNNSGTGVTFNITGSWNSPLNINNTGGLTVGAAPGGTIPSASTWVNSGTFNYQPVLNASNGMSITNTSTGTMTMASTSSSNKANINNDGTFNVTGTYYLAGGTVNNNGTMDFSAELRLDGGTLNMNSNSTTTTNTLYKNSGTVTMGDHSVLNIEANITTWNGSAISLTGGCSSVVGSTAESSTSINSNFLGSNNIAYCGAVPRQNGSNATITGVANNGSGAFQVTISGTGPNNGDYVYITGITGSDVNGYWQVTKINATTYDLVASVFDNAGTLVTPNMNWGQLKLGTTNYLGYDACNPSCVPLSINDSKIPGYLEEEIVEDCFFPNPSNGDFTISIAEETSVKIYTLTGTLVNEFLTTSTIHVTGFSKGVYVVEIIATNSFKTKRLVVQ